MVIELATRLIVHPHGPPMMEGSELRVLHTNAYGRFPALRLYYRFDDKAVYLMDVEVYDPLLPDGRVSSVGFGPLRKSAGRRAFSPAEGMVSLSEARGAAVDVS